MNYYIVIFLLLCSNLLNAQDSLQDILECTQKQYTAQEIPQIVFHGENDHSAKECRDMTKDLARKSVAGDFVLGLESFSYFNDKVDERLVEEYLAGAESLAFGIEEQHSYDLIYMGWAYYLFHANKESKGFERYTVRYFIKELIGKSPYKLESWKTLTPQNMIQEKLVADINQQTNKNLEEFAQQVIDSPPMRTAFQSILYLMSESMIEFAETKYQIAPEIISSYSNFIRSELSQSKGHHKMRHSFTEVLIMNWRNEIMAKNVAKLLCQAIEKQKELHIAVGNAHISYLKKKLTEFSAQPLTISKKRCGPRGASSMDGDYEIPESLLRKL